MELQLHWRVKANCAHTLPSIWSLQKSLNAALNKASGASLAPRGRDAAGKSCQSETRATSEGEGQAGEDEAEAEDADDDRCHEERTWERRRGSGRPINHRRGKGATYFRALLLPQRSDEGERHMYRLCGARYSSFWLQEESSSDSQEEHASKFGRSRRKGRPLESAKVMLRRGWSVLKGGFDTSTSKGGMRGGSDACAA